MANPTIDAALAAVTKANDVLDSVTIWVKGSQARTQAAIDAALANGATAAELAPLTELLAVETSKTADLLVAIAENTPTPPPTSVQLQKARK